MVLDVLVVPDPILKQKASTVVTFDAGLGKFIDDMYDTMVEYHGIGLAAPQVGILQRVVVIWYHNRKMALINPEILTEQGTLISDEGCLSLPHIRLEVKRSDKITLKAQNKKGKWIQLKEKGIISRVIQHELDHLDGILITDRHAH